VKQSCKAMKTKIRQNETKLDGESDSLRL
jgi:hypothetical protein